MILNRLLLCAACLAVIATASAQSTTEADNIIARIDDRMESLDTMIFRPRSSVCSPAFMQWSAEAKQDSGYAASVDAVAKARKSTIKAQTGLQLTGQTYYRPDSKLGLNDEGEGVSRYTGKIQVEARWYFLQSGLLKRKGRMKEIELKAGIDKLEHERGRANPELYANREQLRVTSDSVLASVLLHRVDNLKLLQEAYMYLLQQENVSSDNLLRIFDDCADAERRLSTITTQPVRATSLEGVTAGTVTVDTVALMAALEAADLDLQILDMKAQLLERQAKNTTWWSDVRLAPFARYSHYFRVDIPSSANVDVGLSFTMPINGEAARQRRVLRAEKELLTYDRDGQIASAADKVRYLVLETERLNRSLVGEWERAATLRDYLKMRREAYAKRAGEYNRLGALMEYNSYLRCLESIVEIQHSRDALLADIQAIVPTTPLVDYCTFTPLN